MYINMDKINENNEQVFYKFYTSVIVGSYTTESGKERNKLETKYGVCIFNKKTHELVLDPGKTDAYFLDRSRERLAMLSKLLECSKTLDYPDRLDYASG